MMKTKELIENIAKLKKEKNAVILAHYYQREEIQEIADCIGDSLALAQEAVKCTADIIVLCGVHFMGETAKILNPSKKVLIPDPEAGCSLADSCKADEFKSFIAQYPDHKVISYVNTTAEIKTMTDVVVTSSNAKRIVDSFPLEEKIIFGPDRNLGNYINSITGRKMVLWDGACHVHEQFSIQRIVDLKQQYPKAKVLAHPECKRPLLLLADYIGSTAALLSYSMQEESTEFIVATESGILHEMQKKSPHKTFIPAPPEDSTCACNECGYMKLNTLEKVYNCLLNEQYEIELDSEMIKSAVIPIQRMLELSR